MRRSNSGRTCRACIADEGGVILWRAVIATGSIARLGTRSGDTRCYVSAWPKNRQERIAPPLSNDELRNDIPGHALVQNSPIHQLDLPVDLVQTGLQSRKHVRTEDHLLTQRILGRRHALREGRSHCRGT